MLLVTTTEGAIRPEPIGFLVFIAFQLIPIAVLYRAISGERENRSWDFLLVAPLISSQIVIGKLLLAMSAMLGAWLLGTFLALASYLSSIFIYQGHLSTQVTDSEFMLPRYFLITLVGFPLGLFNAAVTLFLSARTKRAFATLATSGIILSFIHFILILISDPSSTDWFQRMFTPLNIYATLTQLNNYGESSLRGFVNEEKHLWFAPLITCLVASTILLYWATVTLRFPDQEKPFKPSKKNADPQ
jgi:ABC-type transport system involved in multi-copper enzyme maturation permease subunit